MKLSRKTGAILAAGILLIVVIAGVVIQAVWRPFGGKGAVQTSEISLDIHHPDAVLDSAALSRLPRDVLRVPLLHEVLTEDFVDYYEASPTRLSVEGTLRRLAFEHQLDWQSELVRRVFDEPARVLLWRSPDGRLGYWIMSMRRNGFAKLLQGVANVAANDSQLSKVATLDDVPVYALKLAIGHTLLFAARGDRLVVLSAPGVLLDQTGQPVRERAKAVSQMLDDGTDDSTRAFRLDAAPPPANGHRLVVSANYLSFGYQAFFRGIEALRFDFAPGANGAPADWQTAALVDPARLAQQWNSSALWHAVPANAAACASLPVDWRDASALLGKLVDGGEEAAGALARHLAGPVAVCWYAKSKLVAPVFVARLDPAAAGDAAWQAALAQALIGAYEAKAGNAPGYRRLPVSTRTENGAHLWQRPVSARDGTATRASAPFAAQLSAPRYFPVTLAQANGYLVFSPDARLVDDTLAVLERRYPALADTLAPARVARTVLTLTPATSAALVEREVGAALPADQEAIFREAARTHLMPKLHALAHYPPLSLSLPATLPAGPGWVPVEWHFEQAAAAPTGGAVAPAAPAPAQPDAGDD